MVLTLSPGLGAGGTWDGAIGSAGDVFSFSDLLLLFLLLPFLDFPFFLPGILIYYSAHTDTSKVFVYQEHLLPPFWRYLCCPLT